MQVQNTTVAATHPAACCSAEEQPDACLQLTLTLSRQLIASNTASAGVTLRLLQLPACNARDGDAAVPEAAAAAATVVLLVFASLAEACLLSSFESGAGCSETA
jgi:hypothetical protein